MNELNANHSGVKVTIFNDYSRYSWTPYFGSRTTEEKVR